MIGGKRMYGWRYRIGLIVPSCNTVMEPEFFSCCPNGVSIHISRLPIQNVTEKELIAMSEELRECAQLLKDAKVDIIVYGCTSGSLIKGKDYNKEIEDKIRRETDIPVITTATAVLDALKAKGIKKVAVATPYTKEINEKEKKFLVKNGFEVSEIRGLGIKSGFEIGLQESSKAYELSRNLIKNNPEVDGLFISCTNFRTFEIIVPLSYDIRKPVITSNQATLWRALQKGGVSTETLSIWSKKPEA